MKGVQCILLQRFRESRGEREGLPDTAEDSSRHVGRREGKVEVGGGCLTHEKNRRQIWPEISANKMLGGGGGGGCLMYGEKRPHLIWPTILATKLGSGGGGDV